MVQTTYWNEQARLWKSEAEALRKEAETWRMQATDRDGEVQRLRKKMQEALGEDGRFE